jgi:hypothetical protein
MENTPDATKRACAALAPIASVVLASIVNGFQRG